MARIVTQKYFSFREARPAKVFAMSACTLFWWRHRKAANPETTRPADVVTAGVLSNIFRQSRARWATVPST
jgi:hypothetical protein